MRRAETPAGKTICILLAVVAVCVASADEFEAVAPAPDLSVEPAVKELIALGKVWGYLKYHEQSVTAGCFDWDRELLNALDASADDQPFGLSSVDYLLDRIKGAECPMNDGNEVARRADFDWLTDHELLSENVSAALVRISARDRRTELQHYVDTAPGVGNAVFMNESAYSEIADSDWRYRLLALFRYWNIIEYWFPYRDLVDDWDATLAEFIPRIVDAESPDEYALELMTLIARVDDGHANLWSSAQLRPPKGELAVPVQLRFIENQPVVWKTLTVETPAETSPSDNLEIGDVIVAVDGKRVDALVKDWTPYYGASNNSALLREIGRNLLRGDVPAAKVRVNRRGDILDLELRRSSAPTGTAMRHDREGDAFQMLSDSVSYLKLSAVESSEAAEYVKSAAGTKGLIIDIRNYPSAFMVFALGQHLVDTPTPFARFTQPDLREPGTFRWTKSIELSPAEPLYAGRVVILVDETSQSQSEYTTMAFRAADGALVIGSQTAGADGNVSRITLPGGHYTGISGIGVFYPDKTPTQQVGIVPDIVVRPTIEGIRSGRDEVLEVAVRQILGDDVDDSELLAITRRTENLRAVDSAR